MNWYGPYFKEKCKDSEFAYAVVGKRLIDNGITMVILLGSENCNLYSGPDF